MDDGTHLDEAAAAGLVLGTLTPDGRLRTLGHLLAGCLACRDRVAATVARLRAMPDTADGYQSAIAAATAAHRAVRDREQAAVALGEQLWSELRAMPPGRQHLLICNGRQFVTPAVLRAALADFHGRNWNDALEAQAIVQAAVLIAQHMPADAAPPSLLADLRCEVLVAAAHDRRLAGQTSAAAPMLIEATRHLEAGTGDPLAKASLFMEWGRHWQSRRRFAVAAGAYQRVERIYRAIGDTHLAAEALLARADSLGDVNPVLGVRLLCRATRELDGARSRDLEMSAHHLLAWYLNDAGFSQHACDELRASERRYGGFQRYAVVGPAHAWLQGRIDRSLLNLKPARRAFEQAAGVFDEMAMHEQLTMIALDRAELAVAQGDLSAAAALLARTARRSRDWDCSPSTGRHLGRLHAAVLSGQGSRSAFRQAAVVVRRIWDVPPGAGEGS